MNWVKNKNFFNKKGSSIVLLAMVFVTMMLAITASIEISRALVVKSECESFGHLWTKSILSEYDIHLFKDYGIMAYFGNGAEVQKKIDSYLNYSASGKLDASIGKSSSELTGYELGDLENFKKALKLSLLSEAGEIIIDKAKRTKRSDAETEKDFGTRTINNNVVLDTLPSHEISNTADVDKLIYKMKSGITFKDLYDTSIYSSIELFFMEKNLGNHITNCSSKDGYFRNEWEYILCGKCDDKANFISVKNKIILIRNALNLAYLYKDPEKHAIIIALAETLAPGAAGVLTEAMIAEAWAAIETEKDLDVLLDNGRIPFMKTSATWQTDISAIFSSREVSSKLTKEGQSILNENRENIESMSGASAGNGSKVTGQSYDDYLMAMIIMLNENVRILRIMDIIQINFKYWYYRDFNMMEYYVGVRFALKANGRRYDFEDSYK